MLLQRCVDSRDGAGLARLLVKHKQQQLQQQKKKQKKKAQEEEEEDEYARRIVTPWAASFSSPSPSSSFESFLSAVEAVLELYKDVQGAWLAPVVGLFLRRLRQLAIASPSPSPSPGDEEDDHHLQQTKNTLDSVYRFISITAKQQEPARSSSNTQHMDASLCLGIVVQQMRVFSALGQETMIRALISKVVEQNNFPPLDLAPKGTRAAYAYFSGRCCVLEGNAQDALPHLEFAYRSSSSSAVLRRRVLEYLMPAQLALGRRPLLLADSSLAPFWRDVARTVASGDVRRLLRVLHAREQKLCELGTYAMLRTRCVLFCQRNLVRHALSVHRAEGGDANKFPLDLLVPVVRKWEDEDEEEEEDDHYHQQAVLCMAANLVHAGLIKGYISFERRVLVVSAKLAFPPTTSTTASAM